jgi:HEAT repeat protein
VSSDPSTRVRAAALKSLEYVLLPRLEGNNTKEWERALASDNIPYFSSVKRDETQSLVVRLEAAYVLAKTQQSSLQSEAAEFFDQVMLADSLSELSHSYDEAMWLWSLVSDIVDALSFLPEERLTWIKRHAKHPDPKVRAEIVRLLKREQFTESIRVPILSESLGDSSPDVRYAALMLTWHRLDDGIGEVVDIVKSMARNDPSLMIRDRAKSLLTHFHKQETN